MKVRIIVTISIVCYTNIKSPAKYRTISSMAVCCITITANVFFKVTITKVVFEGKYEGI